MTVGCKCDIMQCRWMAELTERIEYGERSNTTHSNVTKSNITYSNNESNVTHSNATQSNVI
jgi:hypothetical protein